MDAADVLPWVSTVITTWSMGMFSFLAVAMYENEDAIREGLAMQLYNPVRWVETIQTVATQGIQIILECGPGKVLVGLNKRIEKSMQAVPVFDPESLAIALKAIT